MADFGGGVSLPWNLVLKDIDRRLRIVDALLRQATGDEVFKLQGEARCLEKLKDLPQSLALTAEGKEKKDGDT